MTTIAGTGSAGSQDGAGPQASFRAPAGLCLRGEILYIADTGNHTIRRLSLRSSAVITIAGTAGQQGYVQSYGEHARFSSPEGLSVTADDYLIVADTGNAMVRLLYIPDGGIADATIPLGGTPGETFIGEGREMRFLHPRGIAAGPGGTLYIADTGHERIVRGFESGALASIDNLPLWVQGGRVVSDSLGTGAVETVGQTFTAPFERMLRRITLPLRQDSTLSGCAEMEVLLMAWDGQKATGPVLYRSGRVFPSTWMNYGKIFLDTGSVELVPGSRYVLFMTTQGAALPCLTGTQFGLVNWTNSIAGGELVRFDTGGSLSAWTTSPWQIEAAHDLALNLGFTGPLPAVQNGTAAAAPYLTHGQTTPVNFGTVVIPATAQRTFRITHRGTFPLLQPYLNLPPGFSLIAPSGLPAVVNPGGNFTATIRLDGSVRGTFAGNVTLQDGSGAEPLFEFPVTGRVTAPELTLTVSDPACPGWNGGGGFYLQFLPPVGGSVTRLAFRAENTGDAPLDVNAIIWWSLPPTGSTYSMFATTPLTGIPPGSAGTLELAYDTSVPGTRDARLQIITNIPGHPAINFRLNGSIAQPQPQPQLTLTAPDFQPQPVGPDGLRRQRILLSNRYCASVPGTRIFIRGLPAGVEVYNASEQLNDGTWVLDLPPFASPLAAREITLEYFAAPGSPDDFFPSIYSSSATVIAPATPAIFAIERIRHRAGGLVAIQFSTVPGRRYQVQFSDPGTPWAPAGPPLRAAAPHTEWTDRGPPRTPGLPATTGRRLYRVAELSD